MNSLIVNFVIRNQKLILNRKNFINSYGLLDILYMQIDQYDIPNRNTFKDLMYSYIEVRKNYCERQILKGNIVGTESEIPSPTRINWLKGQETKKKSSFGDVPEFLQSNILTQPVIINKPRTVVKTGYPKFEKNSWDNMHVIEDFYKKMKADISNQIKYVDSISALKTETDDSPF